MMSGFKPITEKDVYVLDEDKDGTYLEPCKHDMFFKSDVLSALAGLKEKLDVPNPYPVFLFPEIDEKTWSDIDFLLKKYLHMPLDRVSGNIGRRLFEGWKKKMLEDMAYWFQLGAKP